LISITHLLIYRNCKRCDDHQQLATMSNAERKTSVIPITSSESFSKHTSELPSDALQVLYFHAPWAAPCAQMSTVLDTLASTYPISDPPKLAFLSINAEELPDISEEHDVTAVPYIILLKNGTTVETISGGDAAKVRDAVEKHAGSGNKGSLQLPPAQKVTRPAQPLASELSSANGATMNGHTEASTTGNTSAAKDLSSYAPDAKKDPATAPEYTSNTAPSLGTENEDANENGKEDINTRLTELTNAAPCMLFMKGTPSAPQCGFSRQLVSILRENSVRYGFFNILADDEVRQGMKTFADWPTFPQLWMGGELVGGLDIVKEELEGNSDFFGEYSVNTKKRNMGGPAAAEMQARPGTVA